MFHLSHHRLVRFCWLGLVVVGVCLCFFAFLLTTDQPARSSYQPMTIIAYLHDCHCRYDERSNVQKKKKWSEEKVCLSLVLAQSRRILCEGGSRGGRSPCKRMAQLVMGQDAYQ